MWSNMVRHFIDSLTVDKHQSKTMLVFRKTIHITQAQLVITNSLRKSMTRLKL
ncbi:hypothetical protein DCAR_0207548 [Daucus carota subsp. sativus]|uniref:Uncharacterized protein n=1 Tax=Daucus carota subsp. sativus TaxID=79200 RepID=A0A166DZ88_DAUCS|nr:hypothetical protein DCAR_0207548 [Daucus carota subsp. sativus]